MKHKLITPDIREIKTGTPAIKIGDKYFVGGIGGNFIPGGLKEEQVTLGMLDENLNFQKLSFSGTEPSNDGKAVVINEYNTWKGTLPLPEGDGGSSTAEYYKCASVDTANKTWTGYKAVLEDVVYSFEEAVTEGLTYGTAYTPNKNSIYNMEATIKVDKLWDGSVIPTDELLFYAPLASATETAETGQWMNTFGDIAYEVSSGVPCAILNGSSYIDFDPSNFVHGDSKGTFCFSISLWAKGETTDKQRCIFSYGEDSANRAVAVMYAPDNSVKIIGTRDAGNEWQSEDQVVNQSEWNHIAYVNHGTYEEIFLNGSKIGRFDYVREVHRTVARIGCLVTDETFNYMGRVAAVRYYRNAITDEEITALASEFTPTV